MKAAEKKKLEKLLSTMAKDHPAMFEAHRRLVASRDDIRAMCSRAEALGLDEDDLQFDAAQLIALGVQTLECSLDDWQDSCEPWAGYHYHAYACLDIQRASSAFYGAMLFLRSYPLSTYSKRDLAALEFLEQAHAALEALDPEFGKWRQQCRTRRERLVKEAQSQAQTLEVAHA